MPTKLGKFSYLSKWFACKNFAFHLCRSKMNTKTFLE